MRNSPFHFKTTTSSRLTMLEIFYQTDIMMWKSQQLKEEYNRKIINIKGYAGVDHINNHGHGGGGHRDIGRGAFCMGTTKWTRLKCQVSEKVGNAGHINILKQLKELVYKDQCSLVQPAIFMFLHPHLGQYLTILYFQAKAKPIKQIQATYMIFLNIYNLHQLYTRPYRRVRKSRSGVKRIHCLPRLIPCKKYL